MRCPHGRCSLKISTRNLEAPNSKPATMKLSRTLMQAFKDSAGALYCKDLKGISTGKVICTCPECINKACELTTKIVYVWSCMRPTLSNIVYSMSDAPIIGTQPAIGALSVHYTHFMRNHTVLYSSTHRTDKQTYLSYKNKKIDAT